MLGYYGTTADVEPTVPDVFQGRSTGFTARQLLGRRQHVTHLGWSINELAPGGQIPMHLHAYEETFIVLEGQAIASFGGAAFEVGLNDAGVFQLGSPHGWRNVGRAPVRWLEIKAPALRDKPTDTIVLRTGEVPYSAPRPEYASPLTRYIGHGDEALFLPLATPNSPRRARLFRQEMIAEPNGTQFCLTSMNQLSGGGFVSRHDHPFEEAYIVLQGEVEIAIEEEVRLLKPGDYAWAGIGTHHAFKNHGLRTARWFESKSPTPPHQHAFRFMVEWDAARAAQMGDL
ncbi:MAG: cupin domain-containing protein [Chloroflexi bacterium]|nr:cupin domain-containing protein [Chloroflexota bacterium]